MGWGWGCKGAEENWIPYLESGDLPVKSAHDVFIRGSIRMSFRVGLPEKRLVRFELGLEDCGLQQRDDHLVWHRRG